MRVYDDRHASYDRRLRAAGVRALLSTHYDVTLEIPQLAPHRSYFARLNQNDTELDRPFDQNRVQMVASQGSAVSVRSVDTGRQVGNEDRVAAHPPDLMQFRSCTIPNGSADAELIEQRETRRG
jgi:hypothetical protein